MSAPAPSASNASVTAAWRLAATRSIAWALLFGGWLALGVLGHQHLPLVAGGQLPVALWLGAIGALLAWAAGRRVGTHALRLAVGGSGLFTAAALLASSSNLGAWTVPAAALGWAVLLVAVSFSVRAQRLALKGASATPLIPAAVGAGLAWAVAGDLAQPGPLVAAAAVAVATAAGLTVALAPVRRAELTGCRTGLFDCSMPFLALGAWRQVSDWPLLAAALTMLPMMASLPAMGAWCGVDSGISPRWATALHLAAMVFPAWGLRNLLQRTSRDALSAGVGALMLGGAATLAVWAGLTGLMIASVLQAMAWSLSWAGPMAAGVPTGSTCRAPADDLARSHSGRLTLAAAALTALAVLALGLAIDHFGPAALVAVQAGLAGLAVAGLIWRACLRARSAFEIKESHP